MKTLTVTAARQNLGVWLKKTLQGEDIGVMIDGAIVAFRPVKVYSEDYAEQEYAATPDETGQVCPGRQPGTGRGPESPPAQAVHGHAKTWLNPPFCSARAFSPRSKTSTTRMCPGWKRRCGLLPDCFGQPHLHAGISIRRLRGNIFECRAGLKVRLLFRASAQALEVFFVGNHDEVRRLIREL